jgi:hypothetical protein
MIILAFSHGFLPRQPNVRFAPEATEWLRHNN